MKKSNVVLISFDEVRPDHLSCNGYKMIETPNIDRIAESGVLFENAIAAGCFTPICMSSTLCSAYPNKTTLRDPYGRIKFKTAADIFKAQGYKTAGFVGNGVLGSRHGFSSGFDCFKEPTKDTCPDHTWQPNMDNDEIFYGGYFWVDDMFKWIDENKEEPFFVWGHYYNTHRGGEVELIRDGELSKDARPSEFFYADAKLAHADERVIGHLWKTLQGYKKLENTIVVFMSDHGTNFGEHDAKPIHYVKDQPIYPQHLNLFDINVKVALIMMGKDIPKRLRVREQVRTVDILPTVFDILQLPPDEIDRDGKSMMPIVNGNAEQRTAYSENLQPWEGENGALTQSLRTNEFKYIRDIVNMTEEYYDLVKDPRELDNIIDCVTKTKKDELIDLRKQLNDGLLQVHGSTAITQFSTKEREEIDNRLRLLGYMGDGE